MLEKIRHFVEKYNLIPEGSTVVCGLSGGADSVCLITCLSELSDLLSIKIEALHVNHCLRGDESNRDEQFCKDFCKNLGIKLTCMSFDVRQFAEKESLSLEEAARKVRYRVFEENSSDKLVATAHNANDNLETLILNLARGTALKGLAGIPPVRGNVIRPMLTVTRKEIEDFLNQRDIRYVTDSTNLSDDYTRNKIRHNILPLLAELNSSVIETSAGSIDALRAENSFIEIEASKAFSVCRSGSSLLGLANYHEVIRRRCIARLLTENSIPYSYDRLSAADNIALHGGKLNVSGSFYLVSDGNILSLEKILPKSMPPELFAELKFGENKIFDSKFLFCELISDKNLFPKQIVNTKLAIYYMDYDKIKGGVFVRNRRFGDKIKLVGKSFTSSVKKLINETIPPDERADLHFLQDELGTIFAEKIGIADRVAPDSDTLRFLKVTVACLL